MARARLFYVIGASGSGKDSLLRHAREQLSGHRNIVFAHRYITRPHDAGGENHIALNDAEFDARLAGNLFAMHWNSHGVRYGIGCEINQWLAKGLTIIMNGSRAYLTDASRNYPELIPVLIEVSPDVLRSRLNTRGREGESEIESRLLRAMEFKNLYHPKLLTFYNDAQLEETGPAFAALISAKSMEVTCD